MAMRYEGMRALVFREEATCVSQIWAAISASQQGNGVTVVLGWIAKDVAYRDEFFRSIRGLCCTASYHDDDADDAANDAPHGPAFYPIVRPHTF